MLISPSATCNHNGVPAIIHLAQSSLIPNVIPTAFQQRINRAFFLLRVKLAVSSFSDRSHLAPLNERDHQGQSGHVQTPLPASRRAK